MRKQRLRTAALAATLLLTFLGGAPTRAEDPIPRQTQTLPFDASIVETSWVDLSLSYGKLDDSDLSSKGSELALSGSVAWSPVRNVETGVAASWMSRTYDQADLGSRSGVSDTLGWAKFRFPGGKDTSFSIGGFASAPTGDKDEYFGTGNLEGGIFFAGGVKTRGNGFVQGHVGVRWNDRLDNRTFHGDGKNSFFAGFGGVYEAASGIEVFSSLLLETARYEGGDSNARLTGGARWKVSTSWRLQALAGVGLTGYSPRLSLGVGVVWTR